MSNFSAVSLPNVLQDREGESLDGPDLLVWSWFGVFSFQCIPVVSTAFCFVYVLFVDYGKADAFNVAVSVVMVRQQMALPVLSCEGYTFSLAP